MENMDPLAAFFNPEIRLSDFDNDIQEIIYSQITRFNQLCLSKEFTMEQLEYHSYSVLKIIQRLSHSIQCFRSQQIYGMLYVSNHSSELMSMIIPLCNYNGDDEYVLLAKKLGGNRLNCQAKDITLSEGISIYEGYISYCIEVYLNLYSHNGLHFMQSQEHVDEIYSILAEVPASNITIQPQRTQRLVKSLTIYAKNLLQQINFNAKHGKEKFCFTDDYFTQYIYLLELDALIQANLRSNGQSTVFGLEA
jgi:hypothetical protein